MIKRIFYTIYHAFKHKKKLYAYLVDGHLRCSKVTELTPAYFKQRALSYIILDFDGVLANHGAIQPLKKVERWLDKLIKAMPEAEFALFTNKPSAARLAYFQARFPTMTIISGVPKKPYPDGLNQLLSDFKAPKKAVVLVDDRLLTGMLAVCLAGIQGIYITEPYQDFKKNRGVESFFALLRKTERVAVRWLGG